MGDGRGCRPPGSMPVSAAGSAAPSIKGSMPEASTERSLLRILVIDHDAGERASLRAALPGFAVEEVAEGRAGVEAASRSGPDLVLVDGSLPDLEGYEIAIR